MVPRQRGEPGRPQHRWILDVTTTDGAAEMSDTVERLRADIAEWDGTTYDGAVESVAVMRAAIDEIVSLQSRLEASAAELDNQMRYAAGALDEMTRQRDDAVS